MRARALALAQGLPDRLYIGGEWRDARGTDAIEVVDPATGRVVRTLIAGSADDVHDAVRAALGARDRWAGASRHARAVMIERLADAVEHRADDLAVLDTLDNGKPVKLARGVDIAQSIAHLRQQAALLRAVRDEVTTDAAGSAVATISLEPVGVVGLITPWNYPTLMILRALAPALAAGNSVVVKPAEQTPLSALLLAQVIEACGFPAGTVNVVTGRGSVAGRALAAHPDVDLLTFTGGEQTARSISAVTSARTVFELGGKAPFVVLEDADLDEAARFAVRGAFGNQGQNCMAATRILVDARVRDEFERRLVSAARSVRVGDGFEAGVECGPLISSAHRDRVRGFVERATAAGATLLVGGEESGHAYFSPAILADPDISDEVWTEEIFGPVAVLSSFSSDVEAITLANDTRYGLAASVWGRDPRRVSAIAAALRCGVVWTNTYAKFDAAVPFAPRGRSGSGVVGAVEAFRSYSTPKSTWQPLAEGVGA